LYGFKKRGELKLDYNHYDSYPSGFGRELLLFLKSNTIMELNDICDKIILVEPDSFPNEEQIKEMKKKEIEYLDPRNNNLLCFKDICDYNEKIINYYINDFYYLPNYGDSLDGVEDYIYIINLDKNKFEIYSYNSDKKCEYGKYELEQVYDLDKLPKVFV